MAKIKLVAKTKVHFIGIKGVGMTALATILKNKGLFISGSDTKEKFFTDAVLKKHNISFHEKFSPKNIPSDVDVVICSTAYYFDGKSMTPNPEVDTAIAKQLPILTYPEALGILSDNYRVIAIAGTHGKSTTTAMAGWIMLQSGKEPNVIIGTRLNKLNTNALSGNSEYLVVEADEYRDAFLNYQPEITIITSIDYDHPDYFKTKKSYHFAFKKLVNNTKKTLIICTDDIKLRCLASYAKKRGLKVLTYGFSKFNDLVLRQTDVKQKNMFYAGKIHFETPFPTKPYVLNSGAVISLSKLLKIPTFKIQNGVKTFPGTARRMEIVKTTKDYQIIDDYAHHPTAIQLTLKGIKQKYPEQKIIAVFQPHMFSRTKSLLSKFSKSFKFADEVGIMAVYSSAREVAGKVGGRQLATKTKTHHKNVTYLKDFKTARQFVDKRKKNKNIIVLMGAGNVRDIATSI